MAGLKYERFIVKMSLEQKLRLITSTEFYKSSSVGGYEIPVFEVKNQPYDESCKGVRVTQFPSDAALVSSWNAPLVSEVYSAVAAEARFKNSFAYFNCTNSLTGENLTTEHFVLGKFLAEKTAGLRRGGGFVNFESVPAVSEGDEFLKRNIRDTVLNSTQPTSAIFSDAEEAEYCAKRFKYGNLIYGVVNSVEEALDFLYGGASFLFLKEDIFDELLNKLTELTAAFKAARGQYLNGQIAESNYARLIRNFKIFDGEIIDKACNDVIDIVYTMKDDSENGETEFRGRDGAPACFNEIGHDRLAVTAARQSAVLVKNEGGILPLAHGVKLAVMGEYANKPDYQREYYNTAATVGRLPFDVINDYGLNTVGFAAGYVKGERGRSDVADHVDALCAKADCVLVYLAAGKSEKRLPPEQLELLNRLAAQRVKVIAVVASDGNIDTGFTDLCAAVLFTFAAGQGGAVAALDIITGETCPSGKLALPAGKIAPDGSFVMQYPVGHGLSYTRFEYDNLKVNESGVSFTVKNVGSCDGYAVPQLYVRKKNTATVFKNKLLKGYTKVFIKAGDAVRVKIIFDELTFSLYNKDGGYSVEGGLYTVTVGERYDDERLSGILLLKDYSEKHGYKNTVEEVSDDGRAVDFTESGLPEDVKSARKQLPFSLKLTLALVLALYVDAMLAFFALGNIFDKNFIFYLIIAAVAVIVNVLVIVFIAVSAAQRKKNKYLHPNVVLTEMLENVGEFTEIAKVKYSVPVAREEEQEELPEESESVTPDEQLAAAYEVKFDEVVTNEVVRTDRFSFAELCSGLKEYALERGINLEASSARALVAAIASAKLVFLTSKNPDLLPEFTEILNGYFGNETRVIASDDWHNISDLLWNAEEGEDTYVLSSFSNAVYAAHMSPAQERIVLIDNVNLKNLGSYFYSFLEYANHPTEEFVISFNEETSFSLPDNLTYILVPQGGAIDGLPTEILNAAIIADVMLTRADVTPELKIEPKVISHEDFRNVLNEIKEVDFVSERIWKKVDELAETLNSTERFAIGNKNIIQLESFTSVMIDCGADEAEAVTNMFLGKLAYVLKNTHAYRQDGGEKTVFGIIERLFADEELLKIKRVLTKPARIEPVAQPEVQPEAEEETVGQKITENVENAQFGQTVAENGAQNGQEAAVEKPVEGAEEQKITENAENAQNAQTVAENEEKAEAETVALPEEQADARNAEQTDETAGDGDNGEIL